MNTQSYQSTVINPETGFLENPAYEYDFDSQRKLDFIALIRQGMGKYKACDLLKLKDATVFKHLRIDQAFADAVKSAERDYFDELESVSRSNALLPKMVIERIFQLKNRFPEKYGDNKNTGQITVNINVDASTLSKVLSRTKEIEAEIVKEIDSASPEQK